MELSEEVKEKLAEAVQLWADEVLPGRPAILGYATVAAMENKLLERQKKIEETFPL